MIQVPDWRAAMMAVACGVALGGLGGYWLRGTDQPVAERTTPAAQVQQSDGSVVAERAAPPVDKPKLPGLRPKPKKPPHALPAGSTEERRIELVVQPTRENCPPVQVDLSLVRDGEGRRVVASSPDGRVMQALDMPIEAALMPAPVRPWAAGASYDPVSQRAGLWIERDFARLRVGADVQQEEQGGIRAMARVGWRW